MLNIENKFIKLIDPHSLLGDKILVLTFDRKDRGYFHLINKLDADHVCGVRGDAVVDLGSENVWDAETLIPLISARIKPLTDSK